MKIAYGWLDYKILDVANRYKLEKWKDIILLRPDPQIIWYKDKNLEKIAKYDAIYTRSSEGGGEWLFINHVPQRWIISYKKYKFYVKCMGFKHTGIFPEQSINWDKTEKIVKDNIKKNNTMPKILNMFGYTGAISVILGKSGALVTHVDSAKNMVEQCRDNCRLNDVDTVRYIVDDVKKYVLRLIRRKEKFNAIIMDPPSYGRGKNDEIWKLEDDLFDLIKLTQNIVNENNFLFYLINCYSYINTPTLYSMLKLIFPSFKVDTYSLALPIEKQDILLSGGCSAFCTKN